MKKTYKGIALLAALVLSLSLLGGCGGDCGGCGEGGCEGHHGDGECCGKA